MIKIKRVYEKPSSEDGFRILVDRIWPRGLTKEKARVDLWLKDVGPSSELRKWFAHDPDKWNEFSKKYSAELRHKKDLLQEIRSRSRKGTVTILFGAKDEEHNQAVVLQRILKRK